MNAVYLVFYLFYILVFITKDGNTSIQSFIKHLLSDSSSKSAQLVNATDVFDDEITFIIKALRKRETEDEESSTEAASFEDMRPLCSDDELMIFLAEIQAINPESIINLSTIDEVNIVCKQLSDSLDEIDVYLKTCKLSKGKDLYLQLIKGVNRLNLILCDEKSKVRKEFEEVYPCLHDLHEDFETCYGPPDWTEDTKHKDICCAYRQISDCYYVKAAKVCGKKAAKVMKRIVTSVIDSVITARCMKPIDPQVATPMDSSSNSSFLSTLIVFIICCVFALN